MRTKFISKNWKLARYIIYIIVFIFLFFVFGKSRITAEYCWVETDLWCCGCESAKDIDRVCCEFTGCREWDTLTGCYTHLDQCTSSCGGGSSICDAGKVEQNNGCSTGCRQCLSDGTGWICVDASLCDGGGDGDCTATKPGVTNLVSPADNATIFTNYVWVRWENNTEWGEGCPTTPQFYVQLQPQCTGVWLNVSPVLNGAKRLYKIQNLSWGETYCWRVRKSNGTKLDRILQVETRRFTVDKPADIISSGLVSTDICGNRVSGSTSNPDATNPITYEIKFTDDDPIRELWAALVPTTGSYSETGDVVPRSIINSKANNSRAIALKYDLTSNSVSLIEADNTEGISSLGGDLVNLSNTILIRSIGSGTVASISGNEVTFQFQLEFLDTMPTGAYNIYAAAITELPDGTLVSSYATEAIPLAYKKLEMWGVDMEFPVASVSEPFYKNGSTFDITWKASDNSNVDQIWSYVYAGKMGGLIENVSRSVIINPPVGELFRPTLSNESLNLANLLQSGGITYTYRDIVPQDFIDYNFKLGVQDLACNYTDQVSSVSPPAPWLMVIDSSVSALGYRNISIPSVPGFSNTKIDFALSNAYLSTYSLISGTSDLIPQRQSEFNTYISEYNNLAALPPFTSSTDSWYGYLGDLSANNNSAQEIIFESPISGGGNLSGIFSVSPGTKRSIRINGDLNLSQGSICDLKALIMVSGNLILTPDFLRTDGNACMFVVGGDVDILNGDPPKTQSRLVEGINISEYDEVNAMIVTDGTFSTLPDNSLGDEYLWDGLFIKGAVVAKSINIRRNLNATANFGQPSHIIVFDPLYKEIFKPEFAKRNYSLREILD